MAFKLTASTSRTRRTLTAIIPVLALSACNEVDVQPVTTGATVCQEFFEACVNRVLTEPFIASASGQEVTCAGEGCHNVDNGAGGAFKLFPRAAGGSDDMTANFISAKAFVNVGDPAMSKILLEPLTGSQSIVGSHSGGDIFADPNDVQYQELYYWISNPQASTTESCPQLDHFPNDAARRCLSDTGP